MARFVGAGEMSDKTIVYDYPLLCMNMTNLQNDLTPIAIDYNELRILPEHMKHLVGNVQVCTSEKTHMVAGQERRVRSGGIWVLNLVIVDKEKTVTRRGKTYDRRQVSPFTERYFSDSKQDKMVEDEEEVIKI